ncbi:hypothetical protein CAPTEDRAFT_119376 [Capitella teleta]|uniref:FIT family protein n=1 Tax=Capitella teleta TaxID=283909 RepID=R7VF53_CAPTE|nr:hypothetical protein CAPTEDRAFT_119376 [Capitella teleta]|eukprot:ELU17239.1 hypothetical protein CAPTEDRAFT_119376 [Capitella teleta]
MASRARRPDSSTFGRKPSTPGKLPVAEPTSPKQFLMMLLMHVCRKILLVNINAKIGLYAICVTAVSLVTDIFPPPPSYFSNRYNFLNQYFVKLGWGWTLLVLGNFIAVSSYTYCCGNMQLVKRHLSRLVAGTFWWYVCTSVFLYVDDWTGACQFGDELDYRSKRDCIKAGFVWTGFDISGHTFLLMHNLLIISEETRVLGCWDKITEFIKMEEEAPTGKITLGDFEKLKSVVVEYKVYFRVSVVVLTLLQILWEIMLLATVLYFHNMPSKLLAACFAVVPWYLTYHVWFKIEEISPGLPGTGPIRLIKN